MTDPVPAAPEQPPATPDPSVQALRDRGDAPVSEVAERFLRAVVAQVPLELIEELHLFSPLRQGTVETGIAVVATRLPLVVADESAEAPELPFAGEGDTAREAAADAAPTEAPTAEAWTTEGSTTEASIADDVAVEEIVADAAADDEPTAVSDDASVDGLVAEVVSDAGDDDEDVSYAPEAPAAALPRPARHTVYTARYRYVIKGPERGKWESSVKAEADAPLITVETVVRGVQRRAGEESEIVRYTGAQIARALRVPYPA